MASIAELKAPPRFEWKRWPETDEFLDEADRRGLGRQRAWPPIWRAGCRARPARNSRCGSTTWC